MEMTIVMAIVPRPIWMSSPSVAIAAERISIRVPMTRASYSTSTPRASGIFAHLPRDMARGSGSLYVTISPDGGRTLIATVARPRIITPSMSAWPP